MNTSTLDLSGRVPTIDGVPVWPIFGATSPAARYGTMSTGDILDSKCWSPRPRTALTWGACGTSSPSCWTCTTTTPTKLCDLLRFPVTIPGSAVPQGISSTEFEVATEYGVPQAAGPPVEAAVLGYRFDNPTLRGWDPR